MTKFDKLTEIKSQTTDYAHMTIEEGIFRMYYKPLKELNLPIAKQLVKDRIEFMNGQAYPSFFDIQKVESSTKEARDYMANEGNELIVASAILVSSPVLRMMANFFIKVNKPKNPTQMFTSEEQALKWLKQFLK